jgi:hypothetical protein
VRLKEEKGRISMRAHEWRGHVDLLRQDGTCLGAALAHLYARQCADGGVTWHGVVYGGISPSTVPWPSDGVILMRGVTEQDLSVRLAPAVVDRGPVLLQVASVGTGPPSIGDEELWVPEREKANEEKRHVQRVG